MYMLKMLIGQTPKNIYLYLTKFIFTIKLQRICENMGKLIMYTSDNEPSLYKDLVFGFIHIFLFKSSRPLMILLR